MRILALLLLATLGRATTINLSAFGSAPDGFPQPATLGDYLNGGLGQSTSGPVGPGPNLGITTLSPAGTWVWEFPDGHDYLGFSLHLERTLEFSQGFTGPFSFLYAGSGQDQTPNGYTGEVQALDAAGNVLGQVDFSTPDVNNGGWRLATFDVTGVATQLAFGTNESDAGAFFYDAITYNPAAAPTDAPEPSYALVIAGIGLIAVSRKKWHR